MSEENWELNVWAQMVRTVVFHVNAKQRSHCEGATTSHGQYDSKAGHRSLIFQSLFSQLTNKVAALERSGLYVDFNNVAFLASRPLWFLLLPARVTSPKIVMPRGDWIVV